MKRFLFFVCVLAFGLSVKAQYTELVKDSVVFYRNGATVTNLSVLIPIPQTNQYQTVHSVSYNGGTYREVAGSGDRYARFQFNNPSGDSVVVGVNTVLTHNVINMDFSLINSNQPYDVTSEDYLLYTGASAGGYVDPNNAVIISVADSIWNLSQGIVNYAYNCYDYVAENYSYLNPSTGIHPLSTILSAGGGDCGNLSSIFISLLRNKGIPSRHVVSIFSNGESHVWAEFKIEGYGWIPVDVTYHQFYPNGNYFGQYNYNATVVGYDVGHTYSRWGENNTYISDILQNYHWWWWGNGGTPTTGWRITGEPATIIDCDVTTLPYHEGFENGLGCWNTINGSSDGYSWLVVDSGYIDNVYPHDGIHNASSWSWNNDAFHANAWLISPKFILPNTDSRLIFRWWEITNPNFPDSYSVALSTSTSDTSAFTTVLRPYGLAAGTWTKQTVDLTSYAGQSVYISFHHVDYDENYLYIDDISLYELSVAVTGTDSVEVGESATFTATTTPDTATVTWSLPGATPSMATGNTVTATWNEGGIYNVIATAIVDGVSVSDTHRVVVTVPELSIVVSGPDTVYINATATFTASTVPNPVTIFWSGATPTNTGGGAYTATASWNTPGVYNVIATAYYYGSSVSDTHVVTVVVPDDYYGVLYNCEFTASEYMSAHFFTGTVQTGATSNGISIPRHTNVGDYGRWLRIPYRSDMATSSFYYMYPVLSTYFYNTLVNGWDSLATPDNGFMLMSMVDSYIPWGGDGDLGICDAYISLGGFSTVGHPVVRLRFQQIYRKYNTDKCYVDYSTNNSTWNSIEINIKDVDVDVNGILTGMKEVLLPASLGNQSSVYLRLRYVDESGDSLGAARGYFWAVDDVEVIDALQYDMRVSNNIFLNNYGQVPQALQLPITYTSRVANWGQNALTDLTATVKQGNTTLATDNVGGLGLFETKRLVIDQSGFYTDTVGLPYSSGMNYTGITMGSAVSNGGKFPSAVTGPQSVTAYTTMSHNLSSDTLTFNYNVNWNSTDSIGVWAWDHGTFYPNHYYNAYMSSASNYSYDADTNGVWTEAGYTSALCFRTGASVPEGWAIRGIELVPSSKYDVSGAMISPVVQKSVHQNDTTVYYPLSTGAGVHTVTQAENNYGETDTLTTGYNTIRILFTEQPQLESNTAYYLGYRLENDANFLLAGETGEGNSLGVFDAWVTDATYANGEKMWIRSTGKKPMIRMLVGPEQYIPKHTVAFAGPSCHPLNIFNGVDTIACGNSDSVAEGSTVTYNVYSANNEILHFNEVLVEGTPVPFTTGTYISGSGNTLNYATFTLDSVISACNVTLSATIEYDRYVSYTENIPFLGIAGGVGPFSWGIMIPDSMLTQVSVLKGVQLYVGASGNYSLSIYQGGSNAPGNLVYTQNYNFASATNQYELCGLTTPMTIDQTQNLWIVFNSSSAPFCQYMGSINSIWLKYSYGNWTHGGTTSDNSISWAISCVFNSESDVKAIGPTTVATGVLSSFTATAFPSLASIEWSLPGATPSSASGNSVTASWSTPGTYNVMVDAIVACDTVSDTLTVNVLPAVSVSVSCTGTGGGQVQRTATYDGNRCGQTDIYPMGFVASYDFIADAGSDLTHLYVNNVDLINNVITHDSGTSVSTFSFSTNETTSINAVFDARIYSVVANSYDQSMGYVTGSGNYFYDSVAVLTAVPMPHYQFYYWDVPSSVSIYGYSTDNPLVFAVTEDVSVTAYFIPESYTINAVSNNIAYGAVTGGGTFTYMDPVVLTATAYSGYHFLSWSDGSTYNPYAFPATQNMDLTAIFVEDDDTTQYFTITVNVNDASMGSATGGGVYTRGETVTLSVTAFDGYHFVQWQDGNSENPRQVTVSGNVTYTAYFAPTQGVTYTITASAADDNMGYVTGGGTYNEGATATLTAIPFDGYLFDHWQDNVTDNPREITVSADAEYVAYFRANNGVRIVSQQTNLTIYPNPTSDVATIALIGVSGDLSLSVFDMNGRDIVTRQLVCGDGDCLSEIEVTGLATGTYFVRVVSHDAIIIKKFVVK